MVVYGRNPVIELLRGSRTAKEIWAVRELASEEWLAKASCPVTIVDRGEISERCGVDSHQGVCALTDPFVYSDADSLLAQLSPLIVVLDHIEDPQNVGAICRTAEVTGATGVVIAKDRAAQVTAAVCRSSAGAVEHLPVARVTNISEFLLRAKKHEAWVYGAAAGKGAINYRDPDYSGTVVLVIGAEGRGISKRVAGECDVLIELPVRGKIDSLNAAAATAALLYEITSQRV